MTINSNLYLDEFLQNYSQSFLSTGLTRGLDKNTYIETKLDIALKGDILEGKKKLIVLTGNAGDGKTAFIQLIESAVCEQGGLFKSQTDNGCIFEFNGFQFETLYDGSQDFKGSSNESVLKTFFKPFEGDNEPDAKLVKIIAINEGKLRDFIIKKREYSWLGKHVHHYLEYEEHQLPNSLAFVNLNNRSIVELDNNNSIFDKLLTIFLDKAKENNFWEHCSQENCDYSARCYIKQNIDTFLDEKLGPIVQERLKELILILYLKRIKHITIRDIRSLISFILFNKFTCFDIQKQIDSDDNLLDRYYYNNGFNPTEIDRMIALLREIDVSEMTLPKVENKLYFLNPKSESVQSIFVKKSNPGYSDWTYLEKLFNNKPIDTSDQDKKRKENASNYLKAIKRKLYFEGDDEVMKEQFGIDHYHFFPYKSFKQFVNFLKTGADTENQIRNDLVLAISKSEKIYNEMVGRENVCIRSNSENKSKTKAFYSFKAADFEVVLPDIGDQQKRYLEYFPDHIIFRHTDKSASLEINIDLFEILMRIKEGYVPTSIEIQTFFLNLEMFKRRILAKRSTKIVLTEDDTNLYSFEKSKTGKLILTKI